MEYIARIWLKGEKHWRPLGGPHGWASKKLTYLIPNKIVEIGSGLVCLERNVVISTGGKVVFTLPHFVSQPPCLEIAVNLFDTTVCPTTCDDSREHHSKFPAAPRKGREGGNPGIGAGQGALQGAYTSSSGYSWTLGITARSIFFAGGMMLDPSIVSQGGTDS